MSVRIKVARTAHELEDVYRLRHAVYVGEEGYFEDSEAARGGMIVDRFDSFPRTANIIAYDGTEPVGTLRINLDTGAGLPPDEVFDFSGYRDEVRRDFSGQGEPRFVSAGMLAIARNWRNRRDVFRSLFKMAAGVAHTWGVTNIIATVNAKTVSIYRRLGFEAVGNQLWVEEIGEHVIPMTSPFASFYQWAFGHLGGRDLALDAFSQSFQRLVLGAEETLFREGDRAHEAYMVDEGTVRISRSVGEDRHALTLVTLRKGDLFGELSLIDDKPRSADATASTNAELIVLSREDFLEAIAEDPGRSRALLAILAERLRRMDDLAMILAYGSEEERLEFVIRGLKDKAQPDPKRPGWLTIKVGISEIAKMAGVSEGEAHSFLEQATRDGKVEVSTTSIRFRKSFEVIPFHSNAG